jgi:hypothetical protein
LIKNSSLLVGNKWIPFTAVVYVATTMKVLKIIDEKSKNNINYKGGY